MSEKYTALKNKSLERDGRYPFSPDRIRILRRNEDNNIVLQIRLVNNSDEILSSAAVDITCIPSGKKIHWIYKGLSAGRDEFFGIKVPIDTGLSEVDDVEISVSGAEFANGEFGNAAENDNENVPEEQPAEAEAEETVPGKQVNEEYTHSADSEEIGLSPNHGLNKKYIFGICCVLAVIAVVISIAVTGGKNDSEKIADMPQTNVTETKAAETVEISETTVPETSAEKKQTTTKRKETATTAATAEETTIVTLEKEKLITEEKIFNFDGGYINYTEYTYYSSDGWTEYINFSADVVVNDYPYAGTAISNAVESIYPAPSAYELQNSLSNPNPEDIQSYERNRITAVYAENDFLYITVSYSWSTGGWGAGSSYGYNHSYVFDMWTGEEINVREIFKDFESFKQDVVYYADQYIKENVPYEIYSSKPYYEYLLNSDWYDTHNWTFDGKIFTVDFGIIFDNSFTNWAFTDICVPIEVTSGSNNTPESGYFDVNSYGYVDIDSDTLNVRSGPSTSSDRIGALAEGAKVYVYSYEDGWYYIYYDNSGTPLYGYVSSEFIQLF